MNSSIKNAFLLALAYSFSSVSATGVRGANWLHFGREEPKIKCSELLEMTIVCKGDCIMGPETVDSKVLVFEIEIKSKTDKEWQLKEATMAAGSVVRPFEFLPLSTDPQGRVISTDTSIALPYVIKVGEIIGAAPLLMTNAMVVSSQGIDQCQVNAVYR